jgi:hypothetical protein
MTASDPDLMAMAVDELDRACSLSWRDLAKIAPWGDEFDGVSSAGRDVIVARSYLWASEPGGDILCEVVVYGGPSRYDHGARASRLIPKP